MNSDETSRLAVFEGKQIRKAFHEGEWWFSIIDVVETLVGGERPRKYWNDLKKKLLQEGKGDGFECGALDVRSPAGAQDDLCRRYNRLVMRLVQTAALKCGDSSEKAALAKHIWDESRKVLRQPTRWESRRNLYFFEP